MKPPIFDAIILAGGKSVRFNGENKALINFNGKSIFESQIEVLTPIFNQIIVVGHRNDELTAFSKNIVCVEDYHQNFGPLAGIYAGLMKSKSDACFVFSCDMPFIQRKLMDEMIEFFLNNSCEVLVPRINNRIEPLFAIYATNLKQNLLSHIENNFGNSLRSFIFNQKFKYFDIEDNDLNTKNFTNINSKEDLSNLS